MKFLKAKILNIGKVIDKPSGEILICDWYFDLRPQNYTLYELRNGNYQLGWTVDELREIATKS